jgi:catechol 2,3-dioxygenase-like lactoylglutathione lyase family enzyme
MRRFDHVDLRVRDLSQARSFYETLLPALGFERDAKVEGWVQFERSSDRRNWFFGFRHLGFDGFVFGSEPGQCILVRTEYAPAENQFQSCEPGFLAGRGIFPRVALGAGAGWVGTS